MKISETRPENFKKHNIKCSGKTVSACPHRNAERKIIPFTPLGARKLHTLHNTASARQQTTPTHSFEKSAKS